MPAFNRIEINNTTWDFLDVYKLLNVLGSGNFGQVCAAVDTRTNIKVAIKKLIRPFESVGKAKRTYRELWILRHMQHENVIGLHDVFHPATSFENFNDLYLVTDFVGRDLSQIIHTRPLSDSDVQIIIYQILRGLKYLHSAGIIHRDLKPGNIAIDDNARLKILDFGTARHTGNLMTGYVTTRYYRAPEMLLNWMRYNETVDIWSVGCILAELLNRAVLFPGREKIEHLRFMIDVCGTPDDETMAMITSPSARDFIRNLPFTRRKDFNMIFRSANYNAITLLNLMLDLNCSRRITVEQALHHEYFADIGYPNAEPVPPSFDQEFESMDLSIESWRALVYVEVRHILRDVLPVR